jgi:L-ascorbate metabolism protein UlaG (beta-lactamase superfamily)
MKIITSFLLGLLLAACANPNLDQYKNQMLPEAAAGSGKKTMTVTFLGVATLLFDDGETAIMTDGFFSRPSMLSLLNVTPDRDRITRALQRAGVKSLAAVIPVHSHYDHVMDSPIVAQQTNALLVGSRSTANIGRSYQLPEDRMRVVANGETLVFGRFKVTFIHSAHLPTGFATGEIIAPLTLPAKVGEYKEGDCYSLLIEHDGRSILVQGSAGFVPGALKGRRADVVYLGVGGLGTRDALYQQNYWDEIVRATGARRVIPIHWDDFFKSLDEPLVPSGDFDLSMRFLTERGKKEGVEVRLPVEWKRSDPFGGLR